MYFTFVYFVFSTKVNVTQLLVEGHTHVYQQRNRLLQFIYCHLCPSSVQSFSIQIFKGNHPKKITLTTDQDNAKNMDEKLPFGTYPNPASSCIQLRDLGFPEGIYVIKIQSRPFEVIETQLYQVTLFLSTK